MRNIIETQLNTVSGKTGKVINGEFKKVLEKIKVLLCITKRLKKKLILFKENFSNRLFILSIYFWKLCLKIKMY